MIDNYKDNLLASVIHDLKTPINCMFVYIENALESNKIEDIKEDIKIVHKNLNL